jgi:hypothetical protein
MKKVISFILGLALFIGFANSVQAHAGHDHGSETSIRDSIGKTFQILINSENKGNFTINKINRSKTALRLRTTFDLEAGPKTFTRVLATYDNDKSLYYFIEDGDTSYVLWTDFSKLDGEDNSGVRVTYSTGTEDRTVLVENIIIRQVDAVAQD